MPGRGRAGQSDKVEVGAHAKFPSPVPVGTCPLRISATAQRSSVRALPFSARSQRRAVCAHWLSMFALRWAEPEHGWALSQSQWALPADERAGRGFRRGHTKSQRGMPPLWRATRRVQRAIPENGRAHTKNQRGDREGREGLRTVEATEEKGGVVVSSAALFSGEEPPVLRQRRRSLLPGAERQTSDRKST